MLVWCGSNDVYGASGRPNHGGCPLEPSGLRRVRGGINPDSRELLNEQMFNTIEYGWLDIVLGVERLLAAGANVNAVKVRTKETALHLAVQKGWVALVALLLEKVLTLNFVMHEVERQWPGLSVYSLMKGAKKLYVCWLGVVPVEMS